jgi:hypothetical protein
MYSSLWIYLCIAHKGLTLNLSVHKGVLYSFCALITVSACGAVICLRSFNPLKAELNPICHLLELLAHPILHVGRIKVNMEHNFYQRVRCPGHKFIY